MTIAKVINVGAQQLIALPAGFYVAAEQVNISKQEDSLIINIIPNIDSKINRGKSDRQASFLLWRQTYEAALTEADYKEWNDPWQNIRSKENERDFNWDE